MYPTATEKLPFEMTCRGRRAQSLLNPHGVTATQLLAQIQSCVMESISGMTADGIYTTKDFWDLGCWDDLPVGKRRAAGCCLAHLVQTGAIPLERVSPRRRKPNSKSPSGTRRYRLAEPQAQDDTTTTA
jgi:hypothetical protein